MQTCTHEKGDAEHAGDVLTRRVMQSMREMHLREKGVAELQEVCPCGSISLTDAACTS